MAIAVLIAAAAVPATAVSALADAHPEQGSRFCRQLARTTTGKALKLAQSGDQAGWQQTWDRAEQNNPECDSQLRGAYEWIRTSAKPSDGDSQSVVLDMSTFPYAESGDPHPSFLGPIGWWWNTIYYGWFNQNILLMVLFGWEIFLFPIAFALSMIASILSGIFGVRRPQIS